MKRMKKRYIVLIFLVAVAVGCILRESGDAKFFIVKNSTAFAPEDDTYDVLSVKEEDMYVIGGKININTADMYDLDRLTGIGEATAKKIIDYRTKNGNFEVIEDIMNVEGIGREKFNAIQEDITVK